MSQRTSAGQKSASIKMEEAKRNQLKQYNEDDGHFSLVRNFRLADLITIMNGVCGLSCIFSCAKYLSAPLENKSSLWMGLLYPVLGFGFDVFDGKVARWMGSASMLGQEMDSLADLVSFGVSPALLLFTLGANSFVDTLLLSFFVSCGLARLARFNATCALIPADTTGKIKYFEGLPIPSSLALVSTMAYWVKKGWYTGQAGLPLGVWLKDSAFELHPVALVFLVWGALMVSKTLRIPKL
ncbi:cdp-diacylglycerol-serine o-phosphatidyltransferase [Phaffia rhodozyma]|uniref:CDP-diacylglycerol--serine O-phosphatidyltransferase n=1 Tax=Phaffia rhodozyma TaxID=264483 RepID=A0A0F7SSS0_PHARH|nr:cdp-diacylglycerol-serine o-phosphatidyltransferase [Phaffia rhodozyma]